MSMCVWVGCFIIKTIILQKEISLVKMIKPWDIMEIHPLVKLYIHPYNHSFKSWLHSKRCLILYSVRCCYHGIMNQGQIRDIVQGPDCALKTAHWNYPNTLFRENSGSNKGLWRYLKSTRKDTCGVSILVWNGRISSDAHDKADMLNNHFSSVYTTKDHLNLPFKVKSTYFKMPPDHCVKCRSPHASQPTERPKSLRRWQHPCGLSINMRPGISDNACLHHAAIPNFKKGPQRQEEGTRDACFPEGRQIEAWELPSCFAEFSLLQDCITHHPLIDNEAPGQPQHPSGHPTRFKMATFLWISTDHHSSRPGIYPEPALAGWCRSAQLCKGLRQGPSPSPIAKAQAVQPQQRRHGLGGIIPLK